MLRQGFVLTAEMSMKSAVRSSGRSAARLVIAASLVALITGAAAPEASGDPVNSPPPVARPQILTQDVTRFFEVYDAAGGHPTAIDLQRRYIDPGTTGLHQFTGLRNLTGETLQAALLKHPEVFSGARRCVAVMPAARARVAVALHKLGVLYPAARFPPVTFLIGRGSTGGTTSANGVLIGVETLCAANFMDSDLESRFVHLIAHEYVHVQQPLAQTEDPKVTVLTASVIEGGAEFIAELTSGAVGNGQLQVWTRGQEKAIETAFVADEDKTDLSKWLYNGPGTPDKPGDLGYWVGYRIAKAYYQHARDKRAAIRDIIEVRDARQFVKASGWTPGMTLAGSSAPSTAGRPAVPG